MKVVEVNRSNTQRVIDLCKPGYQISIPSLEVWYGYRTRYVRSATIECKKDSIDVFVYGANVRDDDNYNVSVKEVRMILNYYNQNHSDDPDEDTFSVWVTKY